MLISKFRVIISSNVTAINKEFHLEKRNTNFQEPNKMSAKTSFLQKNPVFQVNDIAMLLHKNDTVCLRPIC